MTSLLSMELLWNTFSIFALSIFDLVTRIFVLCLFFCLFVFFSQFDG